ncbi:MAG: DUF1858 domain-containing protein [Nanoarchaeota archaeon]|nr:DUF1858 domain-containing protein [Nanoarchaeota archaeon]
MIGVKMKEHAITKDMMLTDILARYPEVAPILMGYGLHCVACHFSSYDTLENGARLHGMDDETLDMMIKDMETIIRQFAMAESGKNV